MDKAKQQGGLFLLIGLSLFAYGGMVRLDWLHGTLRDGFTPQTITLYLLQLAS